VDVNPEFLEQLPLPVQSLPSYGSSSLGGKSPNGGYIKAQFVHADEVIGPIPSSWSVLGSSAQCAIQGVMEPGRVLTLQGHFEFDRFVNRETIRHFGQSWDREYLNAGLKMAEHDDDAELLAEMVASFYAA
jgi:GMP synthase-like glutamine amidotransferase